MELLRNSVILYFHEEVANHIKAWFHARYGVNLFIEPQTYPYCITDISHIRSSPEFDKYHDFQEIADRLSTFSLVSVIVKSGQNNKAIIGERSAWLLTQQLLESFN